MKVIFGVLLTVFCFTVKAESYFEKLEQKFNATETSAQVEDFPSLEDQAQELRCLFVHERNPEHAYRYVNFGTLERGTPNGSLSGVEKKVVIFTNTEKPDPIKDWSNFYNEISEGSFFVGYKQACAGCTGSIEVLFRKADDSLIFKMTERSGRGGSQVNFNGFCEHP